MLAAAVEGIRGLELLSEPLSKCRNIVIFRVDPALGTGAEFCVRLKEHGLLMLAVAAQQVRAVTHLDVNAADAKSAGSILAEVARSAPRAAIGTEKGLTYA